jgi:8-amino-3,8-dideoxy-alpha-D-manno-octulosonate transaminase
MPGYELFGAEERKEVNDVLETGILMRYGFDAPRKGIWKARELEQEICKYFGTKNAQLVSSGTAALTTALASLGIGFGDEVIIPTFTFVASFEAIVSVGAIPVLVDVDDTLTLNPGAVATAITSKTKAIMPVHMCGSMAQLDELKALCTHHSLFLIEDACQAIGGTYKGQQLGTIGDMGTFSFDFVKIMTCGEGGVVLTNDAQLAEKCDQYSDHGHDHYGKDRGADLHPFLGYNFRISELHAAVGLAQIKKLESFLTLQKRNHQIIFNCLKNIPGIQFRRIPDEAGDTGSFLSFFLPTADQAANVANALAEAGIGGNPYWFDNNWHYIRKWDHLKNAAFLNRIPAEQKEAIMQQANKSFDVSDALMSRCISSAISLAWTEEQAQERGQKMTEIITQFIA